MSKHKPAKAPRIFSEAPIDHDVVIAGDMTSCGDRGYRVAEEVRHYSGRKYQVALLQAVEPKADARIFPEIHTCVRRGLAQVVCPASQLTTGLLVVHGPSEIDWASDRLAAISAKKTILVCHRPADFASKLANWPGAAQTELIFAPISTAVRRAAPSKLSLAKRDWLPPASAATMLERRRDTGVSTAIGWIVSETSSAQPPTQPESTELFGIKLGGGSFEAADICVLGNGGTPSLDRLLALDALAFFPDPGTEDLPDFLVTTALAAGRIVALPNWLAPHFGPGPLYCEKDEAIGEIARLCRSPRLRAARTGTARKAGLKRLAKSLPATPKPTRPPEAKSRNPPGERPVMFLPSNGAGVGHVSRLLAIARRLDPATPVIFVSQAQGIQAIEQFGYLAEYIPSASYIGGSFDAWDGWFRYELELLIDAYDPVAVVYDGNHPSNGLIEAVASRRDCRLAWIRRGLWGNSVTRFMANSRWFDTIVEPGELEAQTDDGVTAGRRSEATPVAPITLLDADELLPRAEAATALGLDPAKPAVLIHVGAGYNRDIVSLIDQIVEVLQRTPDLQICIAEWVNSSQDLSYWPKVIHLRGFPLSQHFRAFDFSIAAAGYNSFHEVINFGLPTIFVPNRHPSLDDQVARAELAQDREAAFVLEEEDLDDLPEIVQILLNPKARAFLVEKSNQLRRPNGAAPAARTLHDIIREHT